MSVLLKPPLYTIIRCTTSSKKPLFSRPATEKKFHARRYVMSRRRRRRRRRVSRHSRNRRR